MKKNKTLKNILSAVLSLALFVSGLFSTVVFAEESIKECEIDSKTGLYLISETETVLGDGIIVVDRYYVGSPEFDGISAYSTTKSYDTNVPARHEALFQQSGGSCVTTDIVTIWVEANFSWNSDKLTATVDSSSIKYGRDLHMDLSIKGESTEHGNNQGQEFLFGHKYAYARYNLTLQDVYKNVKTYYVSIDMNTQGKSNGSEGVSVSK